MEQLFIDVLVQLAQSIDGAAVVIHVGSAGAGQPFGHGLIKRLQRVFFIVAGRRECGRQAVGIGSAGDGLASEFGNGLELAGDQGPGHMVEKIAFGFEQSPLHVTPVQTFFEAPGQ